MMRLGTTQPDATSTPAPSDRSPAGERPAAHSGLLGTWSATRWQYVSRVHPSRAMDVVCDARGAVTLSLSAGTYVVTHDVAGDGTQTQGGTFEVIDDRLWLAPEGAHNADVVRFRLSADTLTLKSDESAWDFNGDGESESASFVAVLVRL